MSAADDDEAGEERRRPTSGAERVTFAVAAFIVLAVLGAILSQVVAPSDPPSPVVTLEAVSERGGRYVVPVAITNEGDETAQDVQVTATLTTEAGETTSDQVVAFLAGGEEQQLEFVFVDDPADGELVVEVGSYHLP